MRTLILGTCYLSAGTEGAQNYGLRLVELWAKVMRKQNPNCAVLLVDSASPVDPSCIKNVGLHRLSENVGHLNTTGRDGWGKAFTEGVGIAAGNDFDFIVYVDADIILTTSVEPIVEKMVRSGAKAAVPMCMSYHFLENGVMFLDTDTARRFTEAYDWESRTRTTSPMDIPEMVTEKLLADDLFTLPLRIWRDDGNVLTVNNLEHAFPYGLPDGLTHCRDFGVYERFLELKGIKL